MGPGYPADFTGLSPVEVVAQTSHDGTSEIPHRHLPTPKSSLQPNYRVCILAVAH